MLLNIRLESTLNGLYSFAIQDGIHHSPHVDSMSAYKQPLALVGTCILTDHHDANANNAGSKTA